MDFTARGVTTSSFFGGLDAAAGYIGVTEAQLRTQLENGKSLAQVAKDHGKSADGLVAALVADAKQKLDNAVSAKRITQAQADEMLTRLTQRIGDLVNSTGGAGPRFEATRGGLPPLRRRPVLLEQKAVGRAPFWLW